MVHFAIIRNHIVNGVHIDFGHIGGVVEDAETAAVPAERHGLDGLIFFAENSNISIILYIFFFGEGKAEFGVVNFNFVIRLIALGKVVADGDGLHCAVDAATTGAADEKAGEKALKFCLI